MAQVLTFQALIMKKWSHIAVKSPLSAVPSCIVFLCIIFFLSAVPGCSSEQENITKAARKSSGDGAFDATLLATIADGDMPYKVIPAHGTADPGSKDQPASYGVVFSESGTGVAYVANKDGRVQVVHNQSRGKEYAAVGSIILTPDGRRIAYGALADGKWRMVVDGKEGRPYDMMLSPIFSPDGQHVAYQAKEGDKWYIVVDNMPSVGTIASYTAPEFSSDSSRIAYVEAAASNDKMRLIVSDLKFGKQSVKWSIGDLLFTTSRGKTRIAAAQVVGNKLRIIDFDFATPDVVHEGRIYDVIERLTLSDDGRSVAYCALKGRARLIVLNGKEEPLPDGRLPELPVIRPDNKGVGLLLLSQNRYALHQSFFNSKEKGRMYDEAAGLTYSKDGSYAYEARSGNNWHIVVNGTEGPAFDRVVGPLFSPDGKRIAYRAKKDGKRFVVVADKSGKTIRQYPSYEQVFDFKFTADGKIAYGVKDGKRLAWKVEPL